MLLVTFGAYVFRVALAIGILSIVSSVGIGQQQSPEELSREAGRIATQAERSRGEAVKKVQAGADRRVLIESDREAAASFEKAIELWRAAGDRARLIAATDEVTRLYSVVGEYEKVLNILNREAEYWRERGDLKQQIETLYLLGIRQMQMRRDAMAIETLERVVEMCRSNTLSQLQANVLTQLAMLYEKAGRATDAQSANARAKELRNLRPPATSPATSPARPRATIPSQWVDLPNAPLAPEYRDVDGVNQAVLVNRSSKGVEMVMFGCVALEDNQKTRVLYGLGGQDLNHGGVRPGGYYRPFVTLNGPLNRWTDEQMGCDGAAKMTLIEASFDDGTTWKAEGADWIVR
jgi:tetratricopeptide (TPR) repeat protein